MAGRKGYPVEFRDNVFAWWVKSGYPLIGETAKEFDLAYKTVKAWLALRCTTRLHMQMLSMAHGWRARKAPWQRTGQESPWQHDQAKPRSGPKLSYSPKQEKYVLFAWGQLKPDVRMVASASKLSVYVVRSILRRHALIPQRLHRRIRSDRLLV
jgi:hypothetical protein